MTRTLINPRDPISIAISRMRYPDFEVVRMATLSFETDALFYVRHPQSETSIKISMSYARALAMNEGAAVRWVIRRIEEAVERIWSRWEAL